MDVYSTDAKITRYSVRAARGRPAVLPAVRRGGALPARLSRSAFPRSWAALQALEKRIDAPTHGAPERGGRARRASRSPTSRASFLDGEARRAAAAQAPPERSFLARALRPRPRAAHAPSTWGSCSPRCCRRSRVGIPLGIWAARSRRASRWIMAVVGPAADGAGARAARVPDHAHGHASAPRRRSWRSSCTRCCRSCATPRAGSTDIPPPLRESARALGLPARRAAAAHRAAAREPQHPRRRQDLGRHRASAPRPSPLSSAPAATASASSRASR